MWCRTCGTVFTDPASSTYLAQIVIEGTVSQKLPRGDLYSVRVYVKKVRKGDKYLPRGRRTKKLIIGDFSENEINEENCITSISSDTQQKYFFFLKNTTSGYVNTAFPAKSNKKTSRNVRKLACRTCGMYSNFITFGGSFTGIQFSYFEKSRFSFLVHDDISSVIKFDSGVFIYRSYVLVPFIKELFKLFLFVFEDIFLVRVFIQYPFIYMFGLSIYALS